MPSAIQHDLELREKGLTTILVESQGATPDALARFLWQQFPTNECLSCVNVWLPLPRTGGLPNASLVSVDGTLLWSGNPLRDAAKLDELIAEQLQLVRKGWGASADAKKARAQLYGRNKLDAAQAIVRGMADGEEKAALQAEIDRRFELAKKRIAQLQERGHWQQAFGLAKELKASAGRSAAWATDIATLMATFESVQGKAELAAAKKLARIVKTMRKGKLAKVSKQLRKLVAKHGDTKVGARAERMLSAF
ncbi:MAG: hypothetical protein AB8H80_18285 [Planctomycetota bacterium]